MKVKRPFLLATLLFAALIVSLLFVGAITFSQAFAFAVLFQLAMLARSTQCGALFSTALSPEQLAEFKSIMVSLNEYKGMFPHLLDLGTVEGGFAAIKTLPEAIDTLRRQVAEIRRAGLSRSQPQMSLRPGQVVTDDCAEHIAAIAISAAHKQGKLEVLDPSVRDSILSRCKSILGASQRTAISSSDIPLPTEYSGQVVQLVNQYGSARKWGTVFPLGAGQTKLPRLKTDTAFGLISQSGTVTEKSPQTEWVTFNAEKFGGLVRMPSEISEDSIVAIGQFIADYAARNIALVEDQVFFLNLDGSTFGAVKGLCGSTITNSKVLQMASTKTHYSDATLTNVRGLRTVPDAAALMRGVYYMHPSFEQLLSTFNVDGNRPYNPNAQLSNPNSAQPFINGPTLDGFPIRWVPVMPAYSTAANVSLVFMLFGDLSYQYLGARNGIRFDTSLDAAFATDEILIRALERFTIGLMANGAIGGLQTAAS